MHLGDAIIDRAFRGWPPRAALLALCMALLMAAPASAQRVIFPTQQASPYAPYTPPAYAPPAGATLQGNIQPAYPQWDPYANPATQAPAMSPYGQPVAPYGQAAPYGPSYDGTLPAQTKLVQEVGLGYAYLHGDGANDFQVDDVELSVSVAFPSLYIHPAPILITPGFNFHFWSGPEIVSPAPFDLPPVVYDAYVAASWAPQVTPWLGADLALSVGVYSDFEYVDSDSLRILGRGLGVVTLSPQWQVKAGVIYLDRQDVKLLPAGGVVWTPHSDMRWEILFPRPKLAHRWTNFGNTEVWLFLAGEYGGGSWSVERGTAAKGIFRDTVDYNDIRISLGADFIGYQGIRGSLEVGYVFERELVYETLGFNIEPDDTVMVRAGLQF